MTLVAINDNGKLLAEEKLSTTPANLSRFFEPFTEPVQAVVECTSYWYWVADWCNGHKVRLILAHAKMLKAISYAKVKTDSVDARTLAELLRVGLIPEAHQCRREQRDLRELTRGRLRMIERRSGLQSSLWQLAAKIGDITRFPSSKQFTSYCRLVPGSKDSGGKHRHRSRNKDGNRYLRIAFNQAAIIAYRDYPVVKEFYKKITRRSGKHVARTVVGKELAKIVWHMLSKNEAYKGFKGRMTRITTQTVSTRRTTSFLRDKYGIVYRKKSYEENRKNVCLSQRMEKQWKDSKSFLPAA